MPNTPIYSSLLNCLYDEPEEKGSMGRGCHYSVFRVAEWFDVIGKPVAQAYKHDFAVIWDEDHDTRVIEAIERLYLAGLLFPVQYIGERKGMLTIILAAKFYWIGSAVDLEIYKSKVTNIMSNDLSLDSWLCDFGMFDKVLIDDVHPHQTEYAGLIADTTKRVDTYIRNIDNLWNIRSQPYKYRPNNKLAGLDVRFAV